MRIKGINKYLKRILMVGVIFINMGILVLIVANNSVPQQQGGNYAMVIAISCYVVGLVCGGIYILGKKR